MKLPPTPPSAGEAGMLFAGQRQYGLADGERKDIGQKSEKEFSGLFFSFSCLPTVEKLGRQKWESRGEVENQDGFQERGWPKKGGLKNEKQKLE